MQKQQKKAQTPKVSVILPVYNVEPYIRQALDSLINQTLSDIEIICVDDCSTDASYDIIKEFAAKDSRIIALKQETNGGPGAARNRGLDAANGEYIMFLDPDDWYEPNACEIAYNQITQNKNDIVLFAFNNYYEQTGESVYCTLTVNPFTNIVPDTNIKLDDTDVDFLLSCICWGSIYKRDFLQRHNIRFANIRMFEDQVFYIKAMLYADTISVIYSALYNYRIHPNSTTFVYKNQHQDLLCAKKEILDTLATSNKTNNLQKSVYSHTIRSTVYWFDFYTAQHPEIKEQFFAVAQRIFQLLDNDYVETDIRPRLNPNTYKKYLVLRDSSYVKYKFTQTAKHLLKQLFSIDVDTDRYKILRICMLKIRIPRKIVFFNYRLWYHLTSWAMPTEKDRQKYKALCYDIRERQKSARSQKHRP